ncbi:MAG: CAP domain-containing protein [Candidatus Eremiobacteraeota bacterium]|nr:CAP domain-containing protein [Candidatus Eremiobacteraeota bacterium]
MSDILGLSWSPRRLKIRLTLALLIALTLFAPASSQTGTEVYFANGHVYLLNADAALGTQAEKTDLAEELLRLTNEVRTSRGLSALTLHPALTQAASSHAAEMLEMNYFSHTSPLPGRRSTRQRVQLYGANPQKLSENIFECSGYDVSLVARFAMESFLQSPQHRANLLDPKATHFGLGVSEKNKQVFISEVFASGF